jgi:hypothetical protein
MKQLNVSLPDDLRDRLETARTAAGRSLGEEIRERLQQSFFWEQFDVQTRLLLVEIGRLAVLTQAQTGSTWHSHAGASSVLRHAITALLARHRPKGEAVFGPDELPPNRPVASDDVEAMGLGLEAIVSFNRPLTDEEQRKVQEQNRSSKEMLERIRAGADPIETFYQALKDEQKKDKGKS